MPDCQLTISRYREAKYWGWGGGIGGFDALEKLLTEKKSLVAKLSWGSGGTGFRLISRTDDHIQINGEAVGFSEFRQIVKEWPDSIVTERLVNHPEIARLYPNSLNTLRIITAYSPKYGVSIVSTYLKIGTQVSGLVDGVTAGGVAAEIDPITGFAGRCFAFSTGSLAPTLISHHPSTLEILEFQVPFWGEIVQDISTIALDLKPTPWLGFDVAVTPEGFFITEINSHTSILVAQTLSPLRSNCAVRELFPG